MNAATLLFGLATAKQDLSGLGSEEPFAEKLLDYIGELVDMFCCLFDANTLGFRISTMDRAMCPRFHVDRVPCRLVTAFYGSGSQYLPFEQGEQNKRFVNDPSSDLHIQTLSTGDVALMKGELWEGNQNAGLIHRSPPVSPGEKRIVMTLDLVD